MKRLMKYVRPEIGYIIVTMIIKFVATYAELWIPEETRSLYIVFRRDDAGHICPERERL